MTEQFFKAIGIEPKSCITSGNFIDSELFFNCDKQKCTSCKDRFLYPSITSDHLLKLEELILGKCEDIQFEKTSRYYANAWHSQDRYAHGCNFQATGNTRLESLLSLILKLIKANILTKEEVRKVFE